MQTGKYGIITDMKSSAKKSQRVLTAIDTAVFAAAAAIFSLCILYVAVSMILGKPSPIYGYGAYDAYELIQRIGALLLVMVPFIMRKCRVMLPSAFTIAYNVFILISVFGGTFMG